MRRKIEGGVGALRESDDTNGQSRNLNIYAENTASQKLTATVKCVGWQLILSSNWLAKLWIRWIYSQLNNRTQFMNLTTMGISRYCV